MNEEGNPLGLNYTPTIGDAVQGIQDYGRTVINFWGGAVKAVPQALTSYRESIREEAAKPSTFATSTSINPIKELGSLSEDYATSEAKTMESVASGLESVGVPTPLAGAAAGIAGAFLPGPTDVNLAMKGGSALLGLTIKDPKFLAAGMGQDVSKTAKFAPTVKVYDERTQAYADLVADYTDSFSKGNISADRLKKNLAKVEKNRKGDTSTFEYDPDNPVAYTESISSSFNPYLSTPKYQGLRKDKPRGLVAERLGEVVQEDPYDIAKKAQQHHVLAKAETKVFADVLNNLISKGTADKDDLVNFFVWPEQYDLFPGNVLKNLLDMGEITHTVAKKDPMALHTILAQAGLEFGSNTNAQIIKRYGLDKVETADDLMKAYDRYLKEIAIPSKDITYKVQDYWIDKTRKTLKGQELIDFNNRVSKLNDPRKPL
jgi:hypothetical protein